jgi:hypothetical protein
LALKIKLINVTEVPLKLVTATTASRGKAVQRPANSFAINLKVNCVPTQVNLPAVKRPAV